MENIELEIFKNQDKLPVYMKYLIFTQKLSTQKVSSGKKKLISYNTQNYKLIKNHKFNVKFIQNEQQ